jgi:hypothetical protein
VLSNDSSLEDFRQSDEMEDVAQKVDSLIAYQPISPDLKLYAERLIQRHKLRSSARDRAENLRAVMEEKGYESHLLPRSSHVQTSVAGSSERVLVVNFEALPDVLEEMTSLIEKAKESIEHFAKLDYDSNSNEEVITPC